MLKKTYKAIIAISALLIFPSFLFAQDSKGLDERINEWFQPITDKWSSIVFYPISVAGIQVPIVVVLLVCGAFFFTVYFSFVNIRRFGLAIKVTRGKYDALEMAAPDVVARRLPSAVADPFLRSLTRYAHQPHRAVRARSRQAARGKGAGMRTASRRDPRDHGADATARDRSARHAR